MLSIRVAVAAFIVTIGVLGLSSDAQACSPARVVGWCYLDIEEQALPNCVEIEAVADKFEDRCDFSIVISNTCESALDLTYFCESDRDRQAHCPDDAQLGVQRVETVSLGSYSFHPSIEVTLAIDPVDGTNDESDPVDPAEPSGEENDELQSVVTLEPHVLMTAHPDACNDGMCSASVSLIKQPIGPQHLLGALAVLGFATCRRRARQGAASRSR